MGNYGSKSNKSLKQNVLKNYPVNEQRVNGSWRFISKRLRYTLTDFERNYQIKIFSKQINKLRSYTTLAGPLLRGKNPGFLDLLNPYLITGFTDAGGSFIIIIRKSPKHKTGWRVEAVFQIGLHKKDKAVLEHIQKFFEGIGNIYKHGKDTMQYKVTNLQDLTNIIIPHFENLPLITQKRADFILFKQIIDLMNRKEHLIIEGLHKIIAIKASINLGLSDELKEIFQRLFL